MSIFIQQSVGFLVCLAFLVRFADLAISYGIARDTVRAVLYGIVAVLFLIALVVAIIH